MTSELERHLQPGEKVLYRDPRYSLSLRWGIFLNLILLCVALLAVPDQTLFIFIVVVVVVLVIGPSRWRIYWVDTWITDRRILQTLGIRRVEVLSFFKEEIEALDYRPELVRPVRLRLPQGDPVELEYLRNSEAFAIALAKSFGLESPPRYGRFLQLPVFSVLAGMVVATFVAFTFYELGSVHHPPRWLGGGSSDSLVVLGILFGLAAAWLISSDVTVFLGLAVLRPFASREEARNFICRYPNGKGLGRRRRWFYSRWASLLFGEEISCDCVERVATDLPPTDLTPTS